MANLHVVKEGGGEMYAKCKCSLPTHEVSEKLSAFDVQFYETPPVFGESISALQGSPYKFVVLEVEVGQETPKFPKAGFYRFVGLTPVECGRLLSFYI